MTRSLFALLAAALPAAAADAPAPDGPLAFKKTVIDRKFRAEGVAVADLNNDGKKDVAVGELWYEAPNWTPHELRKPGDYGDGLKNYSHTFCVWADDLNGDGWQDLIVIDFPGTPCYWLENPKGKPGHWDKHEIWHSACNETPQYVDLFKTGKRVLVMGWQPKGKEHEGQMAWFKPGADPTKTWEMHPVSEPSTPAAEKDGKKVPGKEVPGTFKYAHGLGVGDLNGDGRLDVVCTGGWWEQPAADAGKPWAFHPANLGDACADMYAYDVDGDGTADVVSSSAHKFGVWYHRQVAGKSGHPAFDKKELFPKLVSETHALHCVDLDGDGVKDLVTGKRWWSHGRSEPGSDWPAVVYWLRAKKGSDGIVSFTPHVLDNDSGIGTQFEVADVNGDGKPDIVTSNKKGVFLLEQVAR